ncbi:MAG: DUF4372 domain-containing protein [Aquabacterium sp.]|nr:DUF4372 domain-containing protein [Aquabacterium sp.]
MAMRRIAPWVCADMFRVMAFAQLPWSESLRDVEACLAANRG